MMERLVGAHGQGEWYGGERDEMIEEDGQKREQSKDKDRWKGGIKRGGRKKRLKERDGERMQYE